MIEVIQGLPANVIGLRASGEVTREDYEQVVVPELEAARGRGARIRFLFHFPPSFESFTAGAAWEDTKVGLRHLRLFERCAVVSDKGWLRTATRAMGTLLPTRTKVFVNDELDEAIAWLADPADASTLTHRMLFDRGVLVVEPHGALRIEDFDHLATVVDPYLEQNGRLQGLVVHAKSFPGWENLGTVFGHLRFVRDHHTRIQRVALCADGAMAGLAPHLANHFVDAEIRRFAFEELEAAIGWAAGGGTTSTGHAD